jgi:gliding motility-associated lipoprotein GldH
MFRFLVVLGFALALVSCDSKRVYETNKDFTDGLWPMRDTARFVFTIEDTTQTYNVLVNVRNTIDYETARLFMNYSLRDSSGKVMHKQMLEFFLFDRKTGEPFGESGLGDVYQNAFTVEPSIKFPYRGNYEAHLTHMMRVDSLQEVLSVGVRVEKTQ